MTTKPEKKPGRIARRARRRLADRRAPFDQQGRAGQELRDLVAKGAFHMPGSLKGGA